MYDPECLANCDINDLFGPTEANSSFCHKWSDWHHPHTTEANQFQFWEPEHGPVIGRTWILYHQSQSQSQSQTRPAQKVRQDPTCPIYTFRHLFFLGGTGQLVACQLSRTRVRSAAGQCLLTTDRTECVTDGGVKLADALHSVPDGGVKLADALHNVPVFIHADDAGQGYVICTVWSTFSCNCFTPVMCINRQTMQIKGSRGTGKLTKQLHTRAALSPPWPRHWSEISEQWLPYAGGWSRWRRWRARD